MAYRFDKYCWCVRLSKTRSVATESISKGKLRLDGETVKPSKEVKVGAVISVIRNNAEFRYKILQLLDKRVGAKLIDQYLSDLTSAEEREKFEAYKQAQNVYREYGTGKPSKKDRRNLDDFLKDW